jgi:hypothetical protein
MSWLNSTLAVPTVGVEITPQCSIFLNYKDLLASFFQEILDDTGQISFGDANLSEMTVTAGNGLIYILRPDNISVSCKYMSIREKKPGQLPSQKSLQLQSYTDLLSTTFSSFKKLINTLKSQRLQLVRFGIVAEANLDYQSLPPGVVDLINYFGKPWKTSLLKAKVQLMPIIYEDKLVQTRCHYHFEYDFLVNKDNVETMLDWQIVMKKPLEVNAVLIEKQFTSWVADAINYFELVAEGGHFDE